MNVLEGNLIEDEVASDQFGYYSLLLFSRIILISSSISLFTLYKEGYLMEKAKCFHPIRHLVSK
jgi:hypothetical protein